ncbi:MAG: hypothetical protein KF773_05970 [Deltaproteobacteria bacterium]|nr:hypothetical protein [Deltaproteobacteria bacterium]
MSRAPRSRTELSWRVLVTSVVVAVAMLAGCRGRRDEVEKLADEQGLTIRFAADQRGVAWLASDGGWDSPTRLWVFNSGGQPFTLATGLLFGLALAGDTVYWAAGEHIWKSPRDRSLPAQVAEINDTPKELVVADGFVYWVLPRQIGRIAIAGGTSQLVGQPPIKDALFDHLAVDHDRIVVAVARPSRSGRWTTEVWQLDGEPRRITTIDTLVNRLIIDGETIVWSRYNTKQEEVEIIVMDFAGAQQGASLPGSLLAAHDGMIYTTGYGWTDETYVIDRDRRERRIGPRATDATLVNGRLVGRFIDDEFNTTIGSVPTVGD